jgi:hypothetical protein
MVVIAEEWNFLFLGWPGAPAYFVGRNSERTNDQLPAGIAAWGQLHAEQQIYGKLNSFP